ncbi:Hypothetical protein R9X50_00766800 [Acrodontium crateriforme]|uniref:UBL3-like ubiquitin domain-containing protein n=1 Tax=Acrodontium crateriforme TaxID=150365 RepID=A0AAQ3MC51_9PEZI|nr:Hypothetical protein R9X50_00766800 [Acrodontium crateriforme]
MADTTNTCALPLPDVITRQETAGAEYSLETSNTQEKSATNETTISQSLEPQQTAGASRIHDSVESAQPTTTASAVGMSSSTMQPLEPSSVNPTKHESEILSPIEQIPTTMSALGPATTDSVVQPTISAAAGPTLSITLMLTTGARHPYKIDEKYLVSRKVTTKGMKGSESEGEFDPREVSGYKLKELIWTDWRSEWEPRPASPSAIRLIIFGKMVDDKKSLKDYPFHLDSPNILHMTVKPADFDDDDGHGGKSASKVGSFRARDVEDGGAGCRCVIL